MRRNEPVTQHEAAFPVGLTLVSITDPQGRILDCNAPFIAISGFDQRELLGQPHNVIRHPDMPEEALRDLWQTVQSGLPWTGLVKNRCKNGDHYWVRANVTPMREGDAVTGYLSVRTEPAQEEIDAAARCYAQMQQQARSGKSSWGLRHGQVVRVDALGRSHQALRASLSVMGGVPALTVWVAVICLASVSPMMVPWSATLPLNLVMAGLAAWFCRNWVRQGLGEATQHAIRLAASEPSWKAIRKPG